MFEFKKTMKVHVRDVPKENITRGPFPSCRKSIGLKQPKGFEIHDHECDVCRLKKYLYDLELTSQALY